MKPNSPRATSPHRSQAEWPRATAANVSSIGHQASPPAGDADTTYDLSLLGQSRARWEASAGLRLVYGDIYRAMARCATSGAALEIGSGSGTISEYLPDVVTSDIQPTPFVDRVASAYALEEVAGGPWSTIYALDVLHHLREPFRFFASAAAALRPGGRAVICDPAATVWGKIFYGLFHHEPMRPQKLQAPFLIPPDSARGDFANMGMASALFCREACKTRERLAAMGLHFRPPHFRDVLAYPATGGFSGPRLVPELLIRALLASDRRLPQTILRYLALRMIVVLEKTPGHTFSPQQDDRSQSRVEATATIAPAKAPAVS